MTVSVNIPEDLNSQHLSVDDLISSAFDEQLAAWERLKQRAARGSRESFLGVPDKVPDIEPEEFDRVIPISR